MVKLDWIRFKPTKAVNKNHSSFTLSPKSNETIIKVPAIALIASLIVILLILIESTKLPGLPVKLSDIGYRANLNSEISAWLILLYEVKF